MAFTRSIPFEVVFDGQTITGTMRRLKRREFLELRPAIEDAGDEAGHPRERTTEENLRNLDLLARHVSECLVELRGLAVEGSEVSADQFREQALGEEFYFTGLVAELGTVLCNESAVSGEVEGKSDPPSPGPPPGSTPETPP